jgi:SAM-dependent methyltransferase
MIGCDLSSRALASAEFYHLRVQGDAAACIPLPDGSVDAVVSSYFWEHIPPKIKPAILAECSRVLRAGGVGVFLFDVTTENPLINHFRSKDSARYQQLFVEQDGHVGYQSLAANVELISSADLCVETEEGLEKTWLQGASVYEKLAMFPGGKILKLLSATKSGWLFYFWTSLIRLVDALLCPLLPSAWARISLVTFRKPQEMNGVPPRVQIRDGDA